MSLSVNDLFNFEDLFPTYPAPSKAYDDINYYKDQEYYNVNMLKKEFNILKLDSFEAKPKRGSPLKHQEFVSKFMSPLTLNDRLIAFHALGTGKTCLSVQFAELARKINPIQNKTLVLVRGPTSKRNFMRELANVCTDGDYVPANIELKDKDSGQKRYVKLTPEQRNIRTGKLIRKSYEIETFIKFANDLSKLSNDQISKLYSDRYIIIDEAHNLRFQPKEAKVSLYDQVHRLLHTAQRVKVLLLTATPMRDKPSEIVSLLNLLLPIPKQLKIKDFDAILEDKDKLRSIFYGLVSYVRQMESNVRKIMEGTVSKKMKKIFTTRHKMKSIQNKAYNEYWAKETDKDIEEIDDANDDDEEKEGDLEGDALYEKSRQTSLMVFPDGTFGKEALANKEWVTEDSKGFWHFTTKMKEYIDKKGIDMKSRLKQLSNLSAKYAFMVDQLLKYQNEKAFVYCSFVRGSGILLFGAILEHFGFIKLNTDIFKASSEGGDEDDVTVEEKSVSEKEQFNIDVMTKNNNRFAVITGDSVSSSIADKIINSVFNHPKNTYGDYLRIILGSHVVGEGASLKAVRQLHIASPHWNNSVTEQAIGRGLRAFAHDELKPEERYIKIYRNASIFTEDDEEKESKSIDMRMYKLSEDKDIQIKKVERAMKESAVDCYLNKERNIRLDIDSDNSAACDYEKCDYTCAFVDEQEVEDNSLIEDTYNIFFANREMDMIVEKLVDFFSQKESADLLTILDHMKDHSTILIIRSLKKIIDDMTEITSKNGFKCYLKEDENLYYLTKRIDFPTSFLNSGYANIPEINPTITINDLIDRSSENFMELQIEKFKSLNYNNPQDYKEMIKLVRNIFGYEEKELFLEQFFVADKIGIKKNVELRKEYLDFFSNYIISTDEYYISFYLKPKIYYIEKDSIKNAKSFYKTNKYLSESILNDIQWKEATPEINKIFKDYLKEKREDLTSNNPYGYYAVLTEDKEQQENFGNFVFKIINLSEQKEKKTKKKKGEEDEEKEEKIIPGTKCGTGKFKIPNIIEMMFDIVYVLLKNNEEEDKFPKLKIKKRLDFEDIKDNKHFSSLSNKMKRKFEEAHNNYDWFEDVLNGIFNIELKSCAEIKSWFFDNDLYVIL